MPKLTVIVILLLFINVTLLAQTAVAPAAGSGTEEDPYQIETLENLYWISDNNNEWDKHYIQTADIYASETENWFDGAGWQPIGEEMHPFIGVYDGQDYVIDGIYINRAETNFIGLFGTVMFGSIINLGLINVDITGDNLVGGLVGDSPDLTVENCFSSGSINGVSNVGGLIGLSGGTVKNSYSSAVVTGDNNVGGLVGSSFTGSIENSYSQGIVTGNSFTIGGLVGLNSMASIYSCHNESTVSGDNSVGGLVGSNLGGSVIEGSFNSGDVSGVSNVGGLIGNSTGSAVNLSYNSGEVSGEEAVGGLAGHITTTSINNSYNIGSVVADEYVGGLIGIIEYASPVTHCYSNGSVIGVNNSGGLIGHIGNDPEVINSYWDTVTSGQSTSAGGEGRTTEEMTYPYAQNTYMDWDFEEIWAADEDYSVNDGYPYLQDLIPPVSADDDMLVSATPVKVRNYPNPFNPETTIEFSLSSAAAVSVSIYNIKGQKIKDLFSDHLPAGEHSMVWSGRDNRDRYVASGVYYYRITTGNDSTVKKMLLLK
jgi:hypothetical protein